MMKSFLKCITSFWTNQIIIWPILVEQNHNDDWLLYSETTEANKTATLWIILYNISASFITS